MSNDLTMFDSALPAHLRGFELDATTKALMGGSGGGVDRISIDGSVWRLLSNGKEVAQREERHLNVVVVAASEKVSRTFYAGTYKKGQTSSPDCWSANGDTPDENAKDPQSKSCATCPQNIKGSGQGEGRACRFSQRLAVVLDNDIGGKVYQLTLPSTSIFGEGESGKWPLQVYAKMVASRGVPITAVVTEMRFDTASSTPKVVFKPVRYLEEAEIKKAIAQGKTPTALKAITMTVAQADGVKDTPKLEAPKEEAHEEAPAKVDEPVVRATKKEEPTPKKDLGKILEDWDDE